MAQYDDLIAAWDFDNDAADDSGNGLGLTNWGTVTFDGTGVDAQSAVLASSGYLENTSPGGLVPNGDVGFTIAGWLKWTTSMPMSDHVIASSFDIMGSGGWRLFYSSLYTQVGMVIRTGSPYEVMFSGLPSADNWYYVAAVVDPDADQIRFFWGDPGMGPYYTASYADGFAASSTPFNFNAQYSSGSPDSFAGAACELDMWKAWGRALSNAEIQYDYNGNAGRPYSGGGGGGGFQAAWARGSNQLIQ